MIHVSREFAAALAEAGPLPRGMSLGPEAEDGSRFLLEEDPSVHLGPLAGDGGGAATVVVNPDALF